MESPPSQILHDFLSKGAYPAESLNELTWRPRDDRVPSRAAGGFGHLQIEREEARAATVFDSSAVVSDSLNEATRPDLSETPGGKVDRIVVGGGTRGPFQALHHPHEEIEPEEAGDGRVSEKKMEQPQHDHSVFHIEQGAARAETIFVPLKKSTQSVHGSRSQLTLPGREVRPILLPQTPATPEPQGHGPTRGSSAQKESTAEGREWELRFIELVEFKRVHRHTRVPQNHSAFATLGSWVNYVSPV